MLYATVSISLNGMVHMSGLHLEIYVTNMSTALLSHESTDHTNALRYGHHKSLHLITLTLGRGDKLENFDFNFPHY